MATTTTQLFYFGFDAEQFVRIHTLRCWCGSDLLFFVGQMSGFVRCWFLSSSQFTLLRDCLRDDDYSAVLFKYHSSHPFLDYFLLCAVWPGEFSGRPHTVGCHFSCFSFPIFGSRIILFFGIHSFVVLFAVRSSHTEQQQMIRFHLHIIIIIAGLAGRLRLKVCRAIIIIRRIFDDTL